MEKIWNLKTLVVGISQQLHLAKAYKPTSQKSYLKRERKKELKHWPYTLLNTHTHTPNNKNQKQKKIKKPPCH